MYSFVNIKHSAQHLGAEQASAAAPLRQGMLGGEVDAMFESVTGNLPFLKAGTMVIRRSKDDNDSKLEHYAMFGGVVDVSGKRVRVLSDEATHGDEINFEEAAKAKAEAEKALANATERVDIEHAQALIDRHTVRLNVANLRRHHRQR